MNYSKMEMEMISDPVPASRDSILELLDYRLAPGI
jgi:hypothetical protein